MEQDSYLVFLEDEHITKDYYSLVSSAFFKFVRTWIGMEGHVIDGHKWMQICPEKLTDLVFRHGKIISRIWPHNPLTLVQVKYRLHRMEEEGILQGAFYMDGSGSKVKWYRANEVDVDFLLSFITCR